MTNRGRLSTIGPNRQDRATRERVARQHDAQRGYALADRRFACLKCPHTEDHPGDLRWDATDEQESQRLAAVHAAVERMRAHVASHA